MAGLVAPRIAGPDVLQRAVRLVIRADSDPARQALFATLLRARLAVRLAYRLHERLRGTWGSACLVGCFGIATYLRVAPSGHARARLLTVAQHENARQQVARVSAWVGSASCARLQTRLTPLGGPDGLIARVGSLRQARLRRLLRVIRRLDRRHGFLVSCRVLSAVAWYVRSRAMFETNRPGALLVSSDTNPEEVGFVAAGRALGIPQIFVSHAYPTPLSPPLDFSLSILEGEAAVRARERKGPIRGEILLAGIEGESVPLDPTRFARPEPVIGVFTSKALSWPVLAAVIDDCRRHLHSRQIVIRWHPSMLERPRLARAVEDLSGVVESPRSARLAEVAAQCDWVVADENSNVHLPVLKLGIPTVSIRRLGVYPDSHRDQYGFAASRIIYPPLASLRDLPVKELSEFFANGWPLRFQQFDASYLRPAHAVAGEVRGAIGRLIGPLPSDAGIP